MMNNNPGVLALLDIPAPLAQVATALGLDKPGALAVVQAWESAGLVEVVRHGYDGRCFATLAPLGAARLGVRPDARGRRWIGADRAEGRNRVGHARRKTVNATDCGLDMDSLPARGLDPHSLALVAEALAARSARRQADRRRAKLALSLATRRPGVPVEPALVY